MPESPQRSRRTPPKSGIDPPTTPLRPAAAVTGMLFSLHRRRMAATCSVEVGETTADAIWPIWALDARVMMSGHQSRLASTRFESDRSTSAPVARNCAINSSVTETRLVSKWAFVFAASRSMGGVGWAGISGRSLQALRRYVLGNRLPVELVLPRPSQVREQGAQRPRRRHRRTHRESQVGHVYVG